MFNDNFVDDTYSKSMLFSSFKFSKFHVNFPSLLKRTFAGGDNPYLQA